MPRITLLPATALALLVLGTAAPVRASSPHLHLTIRDARHAIWRSWNDAGFPIKIDRCKRLSSVTVKCWDEIAVAVSGSRDGTTVGRMDGTDFATRTSAHRIRVDTGPAVVSFAIPLN